MQVTLDAFETTSLAWQGRFTPGRPMSRGEFSAFVRDNPGLRIERSPDGELIVLAPAHSRAGRQNMEIARQVANWAILDGSGEAFDSSTGFDLPNGANRSPDVSWVARNRIEALTPEERSEYYPLCPDFVIELRSGSDRLSSLREKMLEYAENGARLGWLIDPSERRVHVYRPGRPVEVLDHPTRITGDPELPGLVVDLRSIFQELP